MWHDMADRRRIGSSASRQVIMDRLVCVTKITPIVENMDG